MFFDIRMKILFAPGVGEKPPHITEIKRAALKIDVPRDPRLNRDLCVTKDIEGSGKPIFMTYQIQEKDGDYCIYVKNAKWSTHKRKR
jgi:hypothetical protein